VPKRRSGGWRAARRGLAAPDAAVLKPRLAAIALAAMLDRCLELTASGQPVHTWLTTP
jgi:hypothetical protein